MQKLLITALVGTLALTACGTDTGKNAPTPTAHSQDHQHKPSHPHAHLDKKGHGYEGTHPHLYQCLNEN